MKQNQSIQGTLTKQLSKPVIQSAKLNHKLVRSSAKQPNPAYEVYIQSLAISGRKSMVSMLQQACRLMGWNGATGYYPWHEFNYQRMQQIKTLMLSQEYSMNSINLTLAGIRGIAKAAFNLELMSAEQLMRIQAVSLVRGKILPKGRSLEKREIQSIINACERSRTKTKANRDKAIFLLGCGGGLRCSELISLQVEDFDRKHGSVMVKHGKGNKQRQLFLSKPVAKALTAWSDELADTNGPMFREIRKNGRIGSSSMSKEGVAKILRHLQFKSGIDGRVTPHDMRRTFITTLLKESVDINSVRKLAGHSSIATTSLYDRRDESALIQASRGIKL